MRIRKVKNSKDIIRITYQLPDEHGVYSEEREYSLTDKEKAAPGFYQAFLNMRRHVNVNCETNYDEHNITVTGVSISYSDRGEITDLMGCVISATVELKNSNAPVNLNTPFKTEYEFGLEDFGLDSSLCLSDECVTDVETLIEEAKRYVNGEREQGSLFQMNGSEVTASPEPDLERKMTIMEQLEEKTAGLFG